MRAACAIFAAAFPAVLWAQVTITPVTGGGDKRPEPRDPRASKSVVPENKKRKAETTPGGLFLPNGSIDMEAYAKRREETERAKKTGGRYGERDLDEAIEMGRENEVLQRALSRQFGVDLPIQERRGPRDTPEESPAERFQIIFMLSFPFTSAAAYGVFVLAKASTTDTRTLTAGETIGFFLTGAALSSLIGWYDYREGKKISAVESQTRLDVIDNRRDRSERREPELFALGITVRW